MLSGLAIAAAFHALPAQAGGISSVDVNGNDVTVHFDGRVDGASAFLLDGPRRIAVDVAGAQAGSAAAGGGMVASVRQGQYNPNTARLVFDLAQPAVISSAQFGADGQSLKLSLKDVSANSFLAAVKQGRSEIGGDAANMARTPRQNHSITVRIPPASKGIGLPKIVGPNDASRPLVVIDAGHGGHDPGAINKENGEREKDVTLGIALAIRDQLLKEGRVRVALTRSDDRFLVLQERYGIARRMNADLFISIHADSAENEEARGATVYTLSETASDREAARLAARENKSDIINGVDLGAENGDVSSILIDLTQRETMNLSAAFARLLHREASPYVSFKGAPHRFASLMVLKAPDTPSVLFETGYISNIDDAAMLGSRDGQRKIAEGVARAIEVHFARKLAMIDTGRGK